MQGPYAVNEVIDALARLDKKPEVEVIVITRGGGSVEDLLPFSDEAMCARCRPAVRRWSARSATSRTAPLLDLVADWRASTPTDAGKRVVPDVRRRAGQGDGNATEVAGRSPAGSTARPRRSPSLRSRPVLSRPGCLAAQATLTRSTGLRDRARGGSPRALDHAANDLEHTKARVVALSPAATLERGYAVVQRGDGSVVRDPGRPGEERLTVRVAGGRFDVTSIDEGAGMTAEHARREGRDAGLRAGPRRAGRRGPPPRGRRRGPRGVAHAVGARRGTGRNVRAVAGRCAGPS